MSSVKIARLNTGEEIIANITVDGDILNFKDPCVLVPSQDGKLLFVKWLPYADTSNGIPINIKDIMFLLNPLKDLEDHYTGAVVNNLFIPQKKVSGPVLSLTS